MDQANKKWGIGILESWKNGSNRYPCFISHYSIIPTFQHSGFCPTCGKHATDVWANQVLNRLLDVPYHHLIMAIPKPKLSLGRNSRIVIILNRQAGLNLLVQAATEAIQQWARDVKQMRMGILIVIHTFGADMKWHPHIHLIVTGGGLSLDGKRWIETDPKFLMHQTIPLCCCHAQQAVAYNLVCLHRRFSS